MTDAAPTQQESEKYRNIGDQLSSQAEVLAKYMMPGVVIAGLTHEIKNILDSTNMALELLRYDLDELLPKVEVRQKINERLEQIENNGERIYHLIQHFRDGVKRAKPESTLVQASELVGYAIDLLGTKLKNTGVRWQVVEEPGAEKFPIYGNKVELEQVFIHLISNAYDALAESRNKSPTIRVEISPSSSVPGVLVRVRDNGPGIPEEVMFRVFELSYTTKPTGTGVGLWLCAFIVERAEGQIELESTGPEGTTFKLHFPFRGDIDAKI